MNKVRTEKIKFINLKIEHRPLKLRIRVIK